MSTILQSPPKVPEQPERSYRICDPMYLAILGSGGFSIVFKANDLKSGQVVALKRSRVSQKVKRPSLQHESRILQMLQGHPAIPAFYGYGQLPHFEYISMELLGDSVREKATRALTVISVVRIVEQVLSALRHVHKHGLVHRDIKPSNLLCSINDPSKIMLVDFGLTKRTTTGSPRTYDPIKEKKNIAGTLDFASLNSHRGIDLAPRDDLESLAYTALFLLQGILPWSRLISSYYLKSQSRVYESKVSLSGSHLFMHFPEDFAHLLDYSRELDYHQIPHYDDLENRFSRLADTLGGYTKGDPIDWTCVAALETHSEALDENNDNLDESDSEDSNDGEKDSPELEEDYDSYNEVDCIMWDEDPRQRSRDASLTLPIDVEEFVDSQIPRIVEVLSH